MASEVPALSEILLNDSQEPSLFDESFAEDITSAPAVDIDELLEKLGDNPQVKQALEQGVDLREYSRKVERELQVVEEAAVEDYLREAENFAALHTQIKSCDGILERMELLLSGFQSELGSISNEIRHLQDESSSMNVELRNRQAASALVSDFVNNAIVPEYLAQELCDGSVNDLYLEYLIELNKKISYSEQGEYNDTLAVKEMQPRLRLLKSKVVSKTRAFLLNKIHSLRKPRTNLQIQQNVMSRYKYLNLFLANHAPQVFQEVKDQYMETLSKIYSTYFRSYIASLLKLHAPIATKFDLLGTEPSKLKSWADRFSKARASNVFALGERDLILDRIEADAIVPHEVAGQTFGMDTLLRSLNHFLLDSVTSEFLFDMIFFGETHQENMFKPIFGETVEQCLSMTAGYLRETYDSVGIVILLRINSLNQGIMARRATPVLGEYFERLNDMLWARFDEVISLNVQSLNSMEIAPRSVEPTRPHYVVRRYGELATSLLSLTVTFKHPQLLQNMNALRAAVMGLLTRLSQNVNRKTDVAHWGRIFLIINLDMILTIMRDRDVVSTESVLFADHLNGDVTAFVHQQVSDNFGALYTFVTKAERNEATPVDQDQATAIVKSFHATWKSSIEQLCKHVMHSGLFSNLTLASAITSKVLIQVTSLNNRMWEIVHASMGPNALSRFYVADFQLADEVKKNGGNL